MNHATFLRNTFTAAALSVTALTALTGAITPAQAATQATVIVQSGPQHGIVIPAPGYFARIAEFCRDNGIVFVADEIQAGIARTGTWYSIEHHDGVYRLAISGYASQNCSFSNEHLAAALNLQANDFAAAHRQ